jgi:hypothetical protein
MQERADEADRLRRKQVEQARYEVDLARRRYLYVDPANRLVADSLEADWNEKLRQLTDAQVEYERQRENDCRAVTEADRARVAALVNDFPRLWQDPTRSRTQTHGALVDRGFDLDHQRRRFRPFVSRRPTQSLLAATAIGVGCARRQQPSAEIDVLIEDHTDRHRRPLNERGLRSGGASYFMAMVARLRHNRPAAL